MDRRRTLALGGLVLASCTGTNAAYEGSGGSQGSGNSGGPSGGGVTSSTETASGTGTTLESTQGPSDSGSAGEPTLGSSTETGGRPSCWSQPIELAVPPGLLPPDESLVDIPILVELADFTPNLDLENLRFYEGATLLAHEFEDDAALAWVRVPQIHPDAVVQLRAVSGVGCADVPTPLLPSDVWSNHYVAVWHFDSVEGSPLSFLDSANGIPLELGQDAVSAQEDAQLGHYVHKSGAPPLQAIDARLDLTNTPLSTLAWVHLSEGEGGILPWNEIDARHREVISKLPGYRLNAVHGQRSLLGDVPHAPFFNISAEIVNGGLHDNVTGTNSVPELQWTMLAGTYDESELHFFSNGDWQATAPSQYSPGSSELDRLRVGRSLLGGIDEVRVSDVARSHSWIAVQYLSMTRAGLLSYGTAHPVDG